MSEEREEISQSKIGLAFVLSDRRRRLLQVIEDLQHDIGEIKDRLSDQKKKIEFQEREIADCTKRAAQLNKDYNEQRKRLQLIESDIEKLRMDRHNYYRTAKVRFFRPRARPHLNFS